MNCTKTVELIEMQIGMLSRIGPGNVLHGDANAPAGVGTSEGVWPIDKYCEAQDFRD